MSSLEARLSAASEFLLQSPPGEVNDVFSDIRLLVSDDTALEFYIVPTLAQYNEQQYVAVQPLDRPTTILVTEAARSNDGRYIDPNGKTSYLVDHIRLTASDPEPVQVDPETETIRSSLDPLLSTYVKNHYHEGLSAVYALEDPHYPALEPALESRPTTSVEEEKLAGESEEEVVAVDAGEVESEGEVKGEVEKPVEEGSTEPASTTEDESTPAVAPETTTTEESASATGEGEAVQTPTAVTAAPPSPPPRASRLFALYFVGNKYNPANYWTGRWRSVYVLDLASRTLKGTAQVNVHYYEQGNVQLSTTLSRTVALPSSTPSPESIIAAIKSTENEFSNQLGDSFAVLSDDGFRGLRRALPKSKCKIDWDKVGHYRLGRDLGGDETK